VSRNVDARENGKGVVADGQEVCQACTGQEDCFRGQACGAAQGGTAGHQPNGVCAGCAYGGGVPSAACSGESTRRRFRRVADAQLLEMIHEDGSFEEL